MMFKNQLYVGDVVSFHKRDPTKVTRIEIHKYQFDDGKFLFLNDLDGMLECGDAVIISTDKWGRLIKRMANA